MLEKKLKTFLEESFKPELLSIKNDSEAHQAHSSSPKNGSSHFSILIVSDAFKNSTRINRHKAVYKVVDSAWKEGLHALKITALTREEYANTRKRFSVKPT